ncbi:MAG TPA: hemolysin family protein [Dehalococcoidia bacterium]|nr:hemolysin family protein [Dehalococcoidia bacterium]
MLTIPAFPQLTVAAAADSAQLAGINVGLATILLVVSVITFALVNSIEIAIVGANRIRIRHLAEQGNKAARALQRLQEQQEFFFSFIVLFQNLSVIVASTMGSIIAAETVGGIGGLILGTGVMTLALALFGEVTPKVLAAHAGEGYPLLVARPIRWGMVALKPLVSALAATPRLLSRLLFGEERRVDAAVSEAELRMLIDMGAEQGTVNPSEAELLESVFHFGDRRVNEVMIPRTEIAWLESEATMADFFAVYAEHPHTRFPVYEETVDNVVGIVNIKDVLRGLAQKEIDESTPVSWAMRQALFAPETKPVGTLFAEMQRAGQQMAVVIDEFGGTAGLVTLEMLLEELVGYVSDELGRHEEEFTSVDERTLRVDAGMSIHDANQELNLRLPDGDYETVAGFILEQLGHIPAEGEQFTFDSLHFQVSQVSGRKIEEVVITKLQEEPAAED